MKLMSVKDAYKMIDNISKIYDLDVNITHGGTYIMKLGELKEKLDNIEFKIKNEYEFSCISINGIPFLNEYEMLDADTINIHMPNKVFNISKLAD